MIALLGEETNCFLENAKALHIALHEAIKACDLLLGGADGGDLCSGKGSAVEEGS